MMAKLAITQCLTKRVSTNGIDLMDCYFRVFLGHLSHSLCDVWTPMSRRDKDQTYLPLNIVLVITWETKRQKAATQAFVLSVEI